MDQETAQATETAEETPELSPEQSAINYLESVEKPAEAEAETAETTEPVEEVQETQPKVAEALAKIARAEARSRAKIEEAEKALKAKESEISTKETQLNRYFDVFKAFDTDPEMALEALAGVMGKKKPAGQIPEEFVQEFQSLKQELQSLREENNSHQAEAQAAMYRADLAQHIASNPDELLEAEAAGNGTSVDELIIGVVRHHYNATGKVLNPGEAHKLLSEHLRTKFEKYSQIWSRSGSKPEAGSVSDTPKTLTNRSASQISQVTSPDHLSDSERRKGAIALLEKLEQG